MSEWSECAVLLCDLQNDFIHPNGAFARAGQCSAAMAALPRLVTPLVAAMRAAGGWIVSTHFTLVPGRGGTPLMTPNLKRFRPFLRQGDFAPGSWGHALVDELSPSDIAVEKIAFSAFYMSRLEWVLNRAGIRRLFITGLATNVGVASTLRDAAVRDYDVTLVADGCAASDVEAHEIAVAALRPMAQIATIAEVLARLSMTVGTV